jgi:hypothetical protein
MRSIISSVPSDRAVKRTTLRTANAGERAASAGSQAARKQIGRIMKAAAVPVGMSWMWTLAFGHHEDRTPTHGYKPTREAAMAAFAKELAAGVVLRSGGRFRFRGQTGKPVLILSLTAADHERLEAWYDPSIA